MLRFATLPSPITFTAQTESLWQMALTGWLRSPIRFRPINSLSENFRLKQLSGCRDETDLRGFPLYKAQKEISTLRPRGATSDTCSWAAALRRVDLAVGMYFTKVTFAQGQRRVSPGGWGEFRRKRVAH